MNKLSFVESISSKQFGEINIKLSTVENKSVYSYKIEKSIWTTAIA